MIDSSAKKDSDGRIFKFDKTMAGIKSRPERAKLEKPGDPTSPFVTTGSEAARFAKQQQDIIYLSYF